VNWRHLMAFVWLRWRLMVNQWRRAGAFSAALMVVISIAALIMAIPLFCGCFALAVYLIPKASPAYLMYAWDSLILVFLLFWGIGLITELQRNDPLSLSKFLHLPVSVKSAFLINYLSSLARLTLLCFVPVMAAFALALVYEKGIEQLPVLPSLAAFLLLITAPTYQFQGWLASLMNNLRRRRTIILATTMGFVLIFQLPSLVNLYFTPKLAERQSARAAALTAEIGKLKQDFEQGTVDQKEFAQLNKEIMDRYQTETRQLNAEVSASLERAVVIANMVLPIGWLPLGVKSAAEGQIAPSLLGLAGMTLLGSASLWLAYRTTLRQYQGSATNREKKAPVARVLGDRRAAGNFLETRLPWLSEPVSAVALGGFCSIVRSPEAKISLLTPLIMGAVFGSMLLRGGQGISESVRPLLGIAAMSFVNFGLVQLMSNQFGLDRDGFRVFVLSAAPRRDILLGKNLAFVPVAFVLSAILLTGVMVLSPMRPDHALAMIPQFISMFLLFCAMANLFSICLPVYMNPGTLKPANPKLTTVLLQLVLFLGLFPLSQAVTLLPLGIEAALRAYGLAGNVPVCLLLTLVESVAILLLYYLSLGWLGSLLQSREQRILETVVNRAL
jgi:ABC-2 type transport system permease protein